MREEIMRQVTAVLEELTAQAELKKGDLVVIGCSSSEIVGGRIGHASSLEAAQAVFDAAYPFLTDRGLFLAAQCCEHLNRALILERAVAEKRGYEIVSAVPFPKAGGSFATCAYDGFSDPVTVEAVRAEAGIDIGGTLIGMHLRAVAVPVHFTQKNIGSALVLGARTRPKYIGGERTRYSR